MAYGNWGAFVYRDGERMKDWEDQTPYREKDYEAGYWQAFGIAKISEAMASPKGEIPGSAKLDRTKEPGPHHAVLGEKSVRLCGYKCYPVLFVNGEEVDLKPFAVEITEEFGGDDGKKYYEADAYRGEIDGYTFSADFDGDNMLDLELVEPDGTKWTSRCGYCYGAGHSE